MINRLRCWLHGHSYAVHHRLLNPADFNVTCCRCGVEVVWHETKLWWVTKPRAR